MKFNPTSKPFVDPDNDPVSPTQQKVLTHADYIWQRIEMIREERNMTKSAFATSIGITPAGYMKMINSNNCSKPVAICIEYRHGFDANWVLTGEGSPRVDQWDRMQMEIEHSLLQDINVFFSQKLKRTRPMVLNKDLNARQHRK